MLASLRNTKYEIRNTERGVALLLTLIVMITLISVVGAYLGFVQYSTRSTGAQIADSQAFYLAEAGIHYGIYRLKQDSGFTGATLSLTQGSFSVTCSSLGGGNYRLLSTGTVEGQTRTVQQDVILKGIPQAFNVALYADRHNINFADVEEATINGDIQASGQIQHIENVSISGEVNPGSAMDFPLVAYTYYESLASEIGQKVEGNKTFDSSQSPYSGIWYVSGKAKIKSNVTINGTIVAEGNIVLKEKENIIISSDSGYPALIAQGNIKAKELENATINGLIYAEGNINLKESENSTFQGTFLAGKNIKFQDSRSWTITYDSTLQSGLYGFSDASGKGEVSLKTNTWQEI